MSSIFVIRHCSATGQDPDAELTVDGHIQAVRLADFLMGCNITIVVTSPFRRARQSIDPFARRAGLTPRVDNRLGERVLCTSPLQDWMKVLQAKFDHFDLTLDGGESSRRAQSRAVAAVEDTLANAADGPAAFVTHRNLMTLMLNHFDDRFAFEAWRSLTNPDVFTVDMEDGVANVKRIWGE